MCCNWGVSIWIGVGVGGVGGGVISSLGSGGDGDGMVVIGGDVIDTQRSGEGIDGMNNGDLGGMLLL